MPSGIPTVKALQIRIKIADKEYTLHADASEEALLRQAAKRLNEQIKATQKRMGIWDRQDLLAMAAFDGMVQHLKQSDATQQHQARLEVLSDMVEKALKGD